MLATPDVVPRFTSIHIVKVRAATSFERRHRAGELGRACADDLAQVMAWPHLRFLADLSAFQPSVRDRDTSPGSSRFDENAEWSPLVTEAMRKIIPPEAWEKLRVPWPVAGRMQLPKW